MSADVAPVVVGVDPDVLEGPRGDEARQRFLSMGALKVLGPQVPLTGPQLLAPLLASVRRMAGGSPIVVATTRPEWAFGTLRLLHRLVDGVVLWGDAGSPSDGKGASAWESLFAAASRMEGDDESGLRVQVRFDLPTLDRFSAALLVGRRWAHWEPLPGRFRAPGRRLVAPSAAYGYGDGCWVIADDAGVRVVSAAPSPACPPLSVSTSEAFTGDGEEGGLLTAARLTSGDGGPLEAWMVGHPTAEHAGHLSVVEAHLQRWKFLRECGRLLGRDDDAFRALMTTPEADEWKAGPLGLARLAGVKAPPGDEGWMEQTLGRVAAAMALGSPVSTGNVPLDRRGRRFVIHVSQLHGFKHAPTALLFSLLEGLLRLESGASALIAVEECLVPSPEEGVAWTKRRATLSAACSAEHAAWARTRGWADRVAFHYARTSESRRERTAGVLEKVDRYDPEVVIGIGTGASVARVLLFERYPYLEFSLGGMPFSGRSHVYVPAMSAKTMVETWPAGLMRPPAIRDYELYVETPEPLRRWTKADLGVDEDAVVLVTVGNRLLSEMSDEFIELVAARLGQDPRLRWVLVGSVDGLAERIPAGVVDHVRMHGYEQDLAGLLTACDLFVNPFRSGGGVSVSMAMKAGIAVLVRGDSNDGRYWVGEADEAWDAPGHVRQLEILTTDIEARRANAARMKARIAMFDADRSARRLLELVEEAKALFSAGNSRPSAPPAESSSAPSLPPADGAGGVSGSGSSPPRSRILVFEDSQSQYGLLGTFASALSKALSARGHVVGRGWSDADHFDAAILTNAVTLPERPGACVVTALLVDHPVYHRERVEALAAIPRALLTTVCRTHVSFLRATGRDAEFLPHGALVPRVTQEGDRPLGVVFAGGGPGAHSYENELRSLLDRLKTQRPGLAKAFEASWARLREQPSSSLHVVVDAELARERLPSMAAGGAAWSDLVTAVLGLIDKSVRRELRRRLLEAFGRAGVAVDVFGAHWNGAPELAGHRHHGEVSLERMVDLMSRAKVVLHSYVFPDGSHERPLNAMAGGAVAVTDDTPWFRENFEGRSVLYPAARPEEAVESVRSLLSDESRRRALAQAGREAVLTGHTWAHRADTWLQLVERRFPGAIAASGREHSKTE